MLQRRSSCRSSTFSKSKSFAKKMMSLRTIRPSQGQGILMAALEEAKKQQDWNPLRDTEKLPAAKLVKAVEENLASLQTGAEQSGTVSGQHIEEEPPSDFANAIADNELGLDIPGLEQRQSIGSQQPVQTRVLKTGGSERPGGVPKGNANAKTKLSSKQNIPRLWQA